MVTRTNRLGATGLEITRVGLGAWAIGGAGWRYAWGPQDDGESLKAIRRAVDAGITWIDTAACYGRGHSEEVVARALAHLPEADRPLIFTKCGVIAPPGNVEPSLVGDPASIRREVEDSLRRLRVEAIDLFQMHWPAQDGTPLEVYWQALVDLRSAGKVRFIGLSNHDREQVARAHEIGRVDTVQPPFSAISRAVAEDLLPWAELHDVGVIVYSPMHSGLLTGAFSEDRVRSLPLDDWRREHPDFIAPALTANLALAEALAEVGARHGVSGSEAAIAWTLGWPGVSGAIVGARTAEQVDGWRDADHVELDDEDYQYLANVILGRSIGSGPVRPDRRGASLRPVGLS